MTAFDKAIAEIYENYENEIIIDIRSKMEGRKVVIFGAGELGHKVLEVLKDRGIGIAYFCDNYLKGKTDERTGVKIAGMEELTADGKNVLVLIAVFHKPVYRIVYQSLLENGFSEEQLINVKRLGDISPLAQFEKHLKEYRQVYSFLDDDLSKKVYLKRMQRGYLLMDISSVVGSSAEELPLPEQTVVKRYIPVIMEKMKREGIAYHPAKTNSDFYLPLLIGDLIQRTILLTDDYFDRGQLDRVFKSYKNGIIGQKISESRGVILDIGANIGNHTLYFCNEYQAKKVYCFEPVKETFAILKENIKLNHLEERVVLNRFGLGEKDSRGSVNHYDLNNIGGTSLRQDEKGDLEIKSLDGIGIDEPVVLIKIDVEGMERAVIKGGMDLLKRNRPYIMVESFEKVFSETQEILCGIGYKYEKLGIDDWLFYPDENL